LMKGKETIKEVHNICGIPDTKDRNKVIAWTNRGMGRDGRTITVSHRHHFTRLNQHESSNLYCHPKANLLLKMKKATRRIDHPRITRTRDATPFTTIGLT
jgi:hypothetical protein